MIWYCGIHINSPSAPSTGYRSDSGLSNMTTLRTLHIGSLFLGQHFLMMTLA